MRALHYLAIGLAATIAIPVGLQAQAAALARPIQFHNPESPSGRQLLFESMPRGPSAIFAIAVDGSGLTIPRSSKRLGSKSSIRSIAGGIGLPPCCNFLLLPSPRRCLSRPRFPRKPQPTDEYCFEWVFDRKFVRDKHVVRGGEHYEGESLYVWDLKTKRISFS